MKTGGGRREPREREGKEGGGLGSDLGQGEEKGPAETVIKGGGDERRRCRHQRKGLSWNKKVDEDLEHSTRARKKVIL